MASTCSRMYEIKDMEKTGDKAFANGEYEKAMFMYSNGLNLCRMALKKNRETVVVNMTALFYSNRAQCLIELEQYHQGIKDCTASIAVICDDDAEDVDHSKLWKSYYRRALCHESLNQHKEALSDLSDALRLCNKHNKADPQKLKSWIKQINAVIDRISAITKKIDDDQKEIESIPFLNESTFDCNHAQHLIENGYVVIDDFFTSEISTKLLSELQSMMKVKGGSFLKQNTTYFKNEENRIMSFSKPSIWEIDLHSIFGSNVNGNGKEQYPLQFRNLYHLFSSNVLSDHLESTLNTLSTKNGGTGHEWDLKKGHGEYAIKLQLNEGNEGCFPWHIDNPGSNKRRITLVLYLNPQWEEGDGGEIVLMPFMNKQIVIPPLFNRGVLFLSEEMNHRVLPAHETRYCFSVWIDRGEDTEGIDQLMYSQRDGMNADTADGDDEQSEQVRLGAVMVEKETMGWLREPSASTSLSRWVYEEEYVESLKECIDEKSDAFRNLYAMHLRHVARLKELNKESRLIEIVELLQKHRPRDVTHWNAV